MPAGPALRSSRPAAAMSFFPELYFNVDNGYLEGLVRGLKAEVLDYLNLVQCETLEGEPRGRAAGPQGRQGDRTGPESSEVWEGNLGVLEGP